jgi:hypothetical protein
MDTGSRQIRYGHVYKACNKVVKSAIQVMIQPDILTGNTLPNERRVEVSWVVFSIDVSAGVMKNR